MMPVFSFRFFLFFMIFAVLNVFSAGVLLAEDGQVHDVIEKKDPYRSTNLPLPRFASVAKEKAFVRTGPGKKYPIKWVIEKQGVPVEITLEFDTWRKIRDVDGQEGWVLKTLLSGNRSGIIISKQSVPLYSSEDINSNYSSIIASLEPSVIVKIKECHGGSCYVDAQGYKGWIERKSLWGVYAEENFD